MNNNERIPVAMYPVESINTILQMLNTIPVSGVDACRTIVQVCDVLTNPLNNPVPDEETENNEEVTEEIPDVETIE